MRKNSCETSHIGSILIHLSTIGQNQSELLIKDWLWYTWKSTKNPLAKWGPRLVPSRWNSKDSRADFDLCDFEANGIAAWWELTLKPFCWKPSSADNYQNHLRLAGMATANDKACRKRIIHTSRPLLPPKYRNNPSCNVLQIKMHSLPSPTEFRAAKGVSNSSSVKSYQNP